MILSLYRQNKFPGIGQMFRYTLRDESNHIEVFRNLFMDLIEENQEIWNADFREELRELMREAVRLEKEFIEDCLPANAVGLSWRSSPSTSITSPTAASSGWVSSPSILESRIPFPGWPNSWTSVRNKTSLKVALLSTRRPPHSKPSAMTTCS